MTYTTLDQALAALTHKCRHLSMRVSLEHCARYKAADINDKGNPKYRGKTPRYGWCQNCPGPIPLDGSAEATPIPKMKLEKMRPNRFRDMKDRSEAKKQKQTEPKVRRPKVHEPKQRQKTGPKPSGSPPFCTMCGESDPAKFVKNNKVTCMNCRYKRYGAVKVVVYCEKCGEPRQITQRAKETFMSRNGHLPWCRKCSDRARWDRYYAEKYEKLTMEGDDE